MRSLFHTAFSPSFRFRIFVILLLGVGYICGMTASTIVPERYCGVAAPCQENSCLSDQNADDCDEKNADDCDEKNADDCDEEHADDCCASDTSGCCFGCSTPTVVLGEQRGAVSLPESNVAASSDERPLTLSTPPLHQPPRFTKYTAV